MTDDGMPPKILEVYKYRQLETLTRHLKQRRWPEPTKFRNPPWLRAFADCTCQSLQQRCTTNENLRSLRVEAQVNESGGDYHGDEARRRDVSVKLSSLMSFCLLYTSPSPRDRQKSRMPSSA